MARGSRSREGVATRAGGENSLRRLDSVAGLRWAARVATRNAGMGGRRGGLFFLLCFALFVLQE